VAGFPLKVLAGVGAFARGHWDELRHAAAVIGTVLLFADTVSSAVHPKDALNILAKSILPAMFASASCCIGGLGVGGSDAEIPQATQRALTRSVAGLFVISAAVSLLTYL